VRTGIVVVAALACGPRASPRVDAGAEKRPPPPDPLLPLREAAASGDPAEMERAALRLPASTLVGAMDAPARAVRASAIAAAERSPSRLALLEALVGRLGGSDRETASRAAGAALSITAIADARAWAAAEVDRPDVGRVARSAMRIAADVRLAVDARAAAATLAARLQEVAPTGAAPLVPAIGDDDPAVRHAALEALRAWGPRLGGHRAAIESTVRADGDARTSLLAAAALCAAGPLDAAIADRARALLPRGRWSDRALLEPCLGEEEAPEARRRRGKRGR
jgi:hypothetical protein